MRRCAALLLAVIALVGLAGAPAAQTNEYAFVATISDTLGVNTGRLCLGDATRGDIGCPTYAPSVSSGGLLTVTSVLTGGLTVTGATSLSTISATVGDFTTLRVNGVAVTGGGGVASPTNVPAFSVHKNGTDQVLANTTSAHVLTWSSEEIDNTNSFSSNQFMPQVAGRYLINLNLYCPAVASSQACQARIEKNNGRVWIGQSRAANFGTFSAVTAIVDLNGTSDYVFASALTEASDRTIGGGTFGTFFQGSLLASGNGLISGSTSTALGDRITSTTANVVAMAGGTISFTTGGTSGTAYLDTLGRFVGPGISTTGVISATSIYAGASIQLASPTAVTACNSGSEGTIRYNSPTTTLELCTGSGWQPMGVGIPAGTISAFASTTCPTGWSEYTAARGRFLRGIDNGAGNDPAGTRAPGATQGDLLGSHSHDVPYNAFTGGSNYLVGGAGSTAASNVVAGAALATGGAETRPKNVAVTFCQFNGTSNGWNNPLSGGGGGTPGGSDTQVQYNSGGSFAGSSGLTFNNAASRLTATNVSASAVEVTGRVSATVMQLGESNDACTTATLGTIRRNPATGKLQICRL